MEYKDYYKILGVERDASQDDIKRAYRKLAHKYHPDVSKEGDAEVRFKEIGEAYKVLKDPETRAAYDQLGANWQQGQEFHPPPDWDAGFEFRGGPDMEDGYSEFFEDLFGRGFGFRSRGGGGFSGKGQDHHAKVLIELDDAYHGSSRSITLQVPELDEHGRVHTRQRTLNVRIPKGVKEGQHIRLSGQGAPGIGGGPAGDLYLEIAFRPHSFYSVDGRDVHLKLPVSPWEAALGATVKVPTPDGPVDMKVPPGSSSGKRMRLKGRGIPGNKPGDLYVELMISVPPAANEEARQLYRKMEQTMAFNPRSKLGV